MNASILFGIFTGYYFGNPKFRAQVDAGVKNLINKGVDTLNNVNKAGAGYEAHDIPVEHTEK
jgi:hypothetical protein